MMTGLFGSCGNKLRLNCWSATQDYYQNQAEQLVLNSSDKITHKWEVPTLKLHDVHFQKSSFFQLNAGLLSTLFTPCILYQIVPLWSRQLQSSETFQSIFTFLDSVLGVPSTLLFIFCGWFNFSMPNSGLGAIPGTQNKGLIYYIDISVSVHSILFIKHGCFHFG